MKRILCALLAAILLLSLCACGKEKTEIEYDEPEPAAAPTATPAPTPEATPAPTSEPTPTPAPTAAPTPSPTPKADDELKITKSPTDETVYEGGSCWFIADAKNFQSIKWYVCDKSGQSYEIKKTPWKDKLETKWSDSGSLFLDKIPLEMDGCTVYAEFTGKTTAKTDSAKLKVKEDKITAELPSGSTIVDADSVIRFTSDSKLGIHIEATRSGESGCYFSSDIASGDGVRISGIDGQRITVTVLANTAAGKIFKFVYTVDAPVPTAGEVRGRLGVRETMGSVPVIIDGKTVTVGIDFIEPDGVALIEGMGCTLYYYGSYDNYTSLEVDEPDSVEGVLGVRESMGSVPVIIGNDTVYVSLDFVSPQGAELREGSKCTLYYNDTYEDFELLVIEK